MSTAGIVLAAGFSKRLGRPKQDLVLGGRTLLQRAVHSAMAADLSPVLVVLNAHLMPSCVFPSVTCTMILNSHAEEGLASSIRAGVETLPAGSGISGAVLMTCDQVLVTSLHLRNLYAQPELVTASVYGGKRGVPAYFPESYFKRLLQLKGDEGARSLLSSATCIEAEELMLDIDTELDYQRAEKLF